MKTVLVSSQGLNVVISICVHGRKLLQRWQARVFQSGTVDGVLEVAACSLLQYTNARTEGNPNLHATSEIFLRERESWKISEFHPLMSMRVEFSHEGAKSECCRSLDA